MFKKTRWKIVAAIMSVLVLLWVGTLGVIYATSYIEMRKQNEQLVRTHAQMYTLPQHFETVMPPEKPQPGGNHGIRPDFDPESPRFRLSTFYTVALSYEGACLEIRNEPPTAYTDTQLEQLARRILAGSKTTGREDNLMFCRVDKGGYMLVAFIDNTAINESAWMLLRYTLIFGSVALALFFFLSIYLAKRIVRPLEESHRKQKQFISDAGHELKTPVSVVSANGELLARELGDNPWLNNIRYENERMGILVGQLLELARTEDVKPAMERLDFSRLVAGEALPFEGVAFETGLTLDCQIAEGIVLEGNPTQLKQLVSILLDNGVRHSSPNGHVQLSLTREHGLIRLTVTNPGDPIPPEQRQQIFERFYRMDDARSSGDHHYGLGLSIAKNIVLAHKGHIEVLCQDGLILFRVLLPAA